MQIDIEANTTIGEESFFEGRFAIRGSLRIDGRFEGQALLVDQLQIGPKGRVKTNIIATSVVVEGVIIGNISSSRRLLLLSPARVLGDIKTPELIIQNGVILEGRCTIANDLRSSAKDLIGVEYEKNNIIPEEFLAKKSS